METIPLDPVRRLTARRMLQSHAESAPVTVQAEADVTGLVVLRNKLNNYLENNGADRISYTPLFIKIAAQALLGHPHLNATLCGDELQLLDEINLSIAVAMPDGNLITPVIRKTDQLTVLEIAVKLADLLDRARHKKILPADMRGGTFTLTNGGMFPAVRWTTPLLNLPQCAILGLGAITPTPIVYNGEIVIRSLIGLSLTFDHRALNGYPVSAFLQTVADICADPAIYDTWESTVIKTRTEKK